jgi:hypothetical protein
MVVIEIEGREVRLGIRGRSRAAKVNGSGAPCSRELELHVDDF